MTRHSLPVPDEDRIPWNPIGAHDKSLPHWRNATTSGCRACERGDDPVDSTAGARATERILAAERATSPEA